MVSEGKKQKETLFTFTSFYFKVCRSSRRVIPPLPPTNKKLEKVNKEKRKDNNNKFVCWFFL